ncbi:MAG: tetratricopeptide repeat protein, partial [Rhodothermaceae bacterium]|nr:tetratricopeptide repeat protein [Rhodothermaceae bacterium]
MTKTLSTYIASAAIKTKRCYVLALVLICLFAGVEEAEGQVNTGTLRDQLSDQLDEARVSLRGRDFQAAIPTLREGLSIALESNDKEFQARYHFQLGVALQQRSVNGRVAQDLSEAAGHYESYLRLRPKTGSALNNLAQIYTQLGREGEASELFARAVALEDKMVGFYAFNYAEFLKDRRAWGESANYYKKALEENPDHPEAREGLLEAYQRIDQGRLITFIWDQIDEGRDVWATTASLQALANLPAEDVRPQISQQKEELLSCVAVGMSRANYGPASKSKSGGKQAEVFRTLEKLAGDADIGPGVKEILSAFDAPSSPELSAQSWWADKGDRYGDPDDGWWPRDAYRMLLRSVGDWHQRRNDDKSAEAYYLQAIHLTDNSDKEPDLQAIVQLADLYLSSNQMK